MLRKDSVVFHRTRVASKAKMSSLTMPLQPDSEGTLQAKKQRQALPERPEEPSTAQRKEKKSASKTSSARRSWARAASEKSFWLRRRTLTSSSP